MGFEWGSGGLYEMVVFDRYFFISEVYNLMFLFWFFYVVIVGEEEIILKVIILLLLIKNCY